VFIVVGMIVNYCRMWEERGRRCGVMRGVVSRGAAGVADTAIVSI
jgi:hypothetical protein